MHQFRAFITILLLVTMPSSLAYPHEILLSSPLQEEERQSGIDYVWSYDEMIQFLDEIDSDEKEETCTLQEISQVTQLLAFLAKEGDLPDDSEESLFLDYDIENLLSEEEDFYKEMHSLIGRCDPQYLVIPALFYGEGKTILCKSWAKKKWKHVRKFAKKHKKALIIGAAVVVAAAVVVVAVTAASSAAASAAAAGAIKVANPSDSKSTGKAPESAEIAATHEAPILKSALDNQIASFKETAVQNQFFQSVNPQQGLSLEENGRALGSLLAHDSLNQIQHQSLVSPKLAQEIQEIRSKYTFQIPGWKQGQPMGHLGIDRQFATDYSAFYTRPGESCDFHTLSHQVRGERALELGYYHQAVQDFGKAIEINPDNPLPYLERGIAHFNLGQYDRSLEDYHQFTAQTPASKVQPLSMAEFTTGFAKGLPKGVYDSGKNLFLFLADFVQHPINTSTQIVDSVTTLVELVHKDEWGVVAQSLSPEVHHLVTEWNTLPSEKRGELAGYALGKHGTDILAPGALAKVATKSVQCAQELASVCKNLQIAQEALLLETAAGMGSAAKIAEMVKEGQTTIRMAEELGFSARELGQLKQAGKLESTIAHSSECVAANPHIHKSFELFDRAQAFLKPYKQYMPEAQCRELIHQTGIPTFPRPTGVPENFRVKIAKKGAGLIYRHPEHNYTSIRIMPGKPHSPFPYQQKPYVLYQKDGKNFDKFGNVVNKKDPEAHIPLEEFLFKE